MVMRNHDDNAPIAPAREALARIDQSRGVSIAFVDGTTHHEARARLAKLSDQVLTYTDATSFAVMGAARCRWALSFDNDFVVAGFRLWEGGAARGPRKR